jgi:hypothetical protein
MNGTALLGQIGKMESEFHDHLNNAYFVMGESILRNLRRSLPVTKTKLDWHKVCIFCYCFFETYAFPVRNQSRPNCILTTADSLRLTVAMHLLTCPTLPLEKDLKL